MKRVVIMVIIVLILLFTSFMIGLGWYMLIPEKITEMVQGNSESAPVNSVASNVEANKTSEIGSKWIKVEIRERAAYKGNRYAEVNVTLVNINNFRGSARIEATLHYSQNQVATSTAVFDDLVPNKETVRTIRVNTTRQWNAFDVKQVT